MKTISATRCTTIPRFQFHLPYRCLNNGIITADEEIIHRIKDVDNFYNALGYTGEVRNMGLSFDEFIRIEYRKDNCKKSEVCLQARIINYLIQYSAMFMKKYADQYEDWLGRCAEEASGNFDSCVDCIMHPYQREQEYFNCMTTSEVTFYTTTI